MSTLISTSRHNTDISHAVTQCHTPPSDIIYLVAISPCIAGRGHAGACICICSYSMQEISWKRQKIEHHRGLMISAINSESERQSPQPETVSKYLPSISCGQGRKTSWSARHIVTAENNNNRTEMCDLAPKHPTDLTAGHSADLRSNEDGGGSSAMLVRPH